jgi:hypothetical protein
MVVYPSLDSIDSSPLNAQDIHDATNTFEAQILATTGWTSSQNVSYASSTDGTDSSTPDYNWRKLLKDLLAILRWLASQ